MSDVSDRVAERARRCREASRVMAYSSGEQRNDALRHTAERLRTRMSKILHANAIDMERGEQKGLSSAMLDRLRLDEERINDMAMACEQILALEDPIGQVIEEWSRPNGLHIQKVRVPIGVIGIIYESRPNVTIDAASLCLKAGNAALLRGGSEAINSNLALGEVLTDACRDAGLPVGAVEILDFTDREAVRAMAQLSEYIDLIIPRGGHDLIRAVTEDAKVPVLEHERGLTQIYVDATCDVDMAVTLVHNAKVQRPGVCNAVENLFVHSANTNALRAICSDLQASGVEIRGCPRTCKVVEGCVPAKDEDWDTEYLDLILAVRVVDSIEEGMELIRRHTSGLTELIITDNEANAERFLREIDSACVYWNASTRFTDGGQFGFGAEIGISTAKIHARGPMAVRELTTYKYVIRGDGQVRQ
ncbi:MAG: glutamate-5-semialdehyde dehydrogenase [Armatimonadota bacterium]